MGFTVNIYYTGKNGSARKFAEEMISSGLVELIRAEEGNERYEYFLPLGASGDTVLLIDAWRDQAALDAHHQSEMMERIAELRKKYQLRMRVERFAALPGERENRERDR